jgi:hypothetical protein
MILIESKKKKPITWHVDGEKSFPVLSTKDVTLISASGTELDAILKCYHNIPHTSAGTQVWVGEFARQLFANLQYVLAYHNVAESNIAIGVLDE